jgi:hypothetical protein
MSETVRILTTFMEEFLFSCHWANQGCPAS